MSAEFQVDPEQLEHVLALMSGVEFELFVRDVLLANPARFRKVQHMGWAQRHLFDLWALDDRHDGAQTYFEVKKRPAVLPDVLDGIAFEAEQLRASKPDARVVLVISGLPTEAAARAASARRIQIWGKLSLASLTPPALLAAKRAELQGRATDPLPSAGGVELGKALSTIPAGKADALVYQHHVVKTFEHLFVPPLEPPREELNDRERRNRRDAIFENPGIHPFWEGLRRHYRADFVVLDAKNYAQGPNKHAVTSVAHYLKKYGPGLFAIIASRKGPRPDAVHAAREQWISGEKMIVFVTDDDIREMLELAGKGGAPEVIIRNRIADMRLAL